MPFLVTVTQQDPTWAYPEDSLTAVATCLQCNEQFELGWRGYSASSMIVTLSDHERDVHGVQHPARKVV